MKLLRVTDRGEDAVVDYRSVSPVPTLTTMRVTAGAREGRL